MKRPVNINLLKIKLPLTALLSITHRLSGMFVFFVVLPLTAISLYYLAESLDSYEQFSGLIESNFGLKVSFSIMSYHF
jgi:succinate dehydrogenase / fumarate reductase cytochrome b subunit